MNKTFRNHLQATELLLSKVWTSAELSQAMGCSNSAANRILREAVRDRFMDIQRAPKDDPRAPGPATYCYVPRFKLFKVRD